jgi:hypothetical protein
VTDTVFLVGGPADGKTYAVLDRNRPIHVAVPPRSLMARFWHTDAPIADDMVIKQVTYHTHLLTPLAHSLMK